MKRLIAIASLAWVVAGAAGAQNPGSIGAFADMAGTDCNIVDTGSLVTVHIVHLYTDGATAVGFMLDVSQTTWIHLGDNLSFPGGGYTGRSIEGISIGFGACLVGPVYLMAVLFFGSNEPPCTNISIVPHPNALSGKIEAMDCGDPGQKFFPTGYDAMVNHTPDCPCSAPVPVRDATWGRIKALYR